MRRITDGSAGAKRILDLAEKHVITTRHFIGDFSSEAAAYRTAKRLRSDGQLKSVGFVRGVSGRPVVAFCNSWKPRANQLLHEVLLTDALMCYPGATFVRGWQVDSRIRPDAEMTWKDRKYYVELDTGEQSYRQVQLRQRAYIGVQKEWLLYVTMTKTRMAGLMRHSEAVRSIALFTTLDSVMADPDGEIWEDSEGIRVSITKGL